MLNLNGNNSVSGSLDVSIISDTSTPRMIEITREQVAMAAMQAILGWPEEERKVLLATHVLSGAVTGSMESAIVEQAFKLANAFEARRYTRP